MKNVLSTLGIGLLVVLTGLSLAFVIAGKQKNIISLTDSHVDKELAGMFVTFDTARYLNARRASMVELISEANSGNYDNNPAAIIKRVDNLARPTIERIANGRMVVVKQALALTDQVPDITDQVLEELGLPKIEATIQAPSIASTVSPELFELAEKLNQEREKKAALKAEDNARAILDYENKQYLP